MQYICWSVGRWVGRSVNQSINRSIEQSISQLVSQSVSQLVSQSSNHWISQLFIYARCASELLQWERLRRSKNDLKEVRVHLKCEFQLYFTKLAEHTYERHKPLLTCHTVCYMSGCHIIIKSNPCIRRLSPQYDRQSKFWCPNETIR